MPWPSSSVSTTNLDAGTDNPQIARADLLDLVQKFNELRAHVSAFAQTLLDDADAAAVRATLGGTTTGGALFTAADAAAARAAIAAAAAASTVNLTGAQTVAGLKTFSDGALSANASQPIGYGVGAGGLVTQTTSRATAVTLNRPSGFITTYGLDSVAAGASFTFRLNNSAIGTGSVVIAQHTGNDWRVDVSTSTGFADIKSTNLLGTSRSGSAFIAFAVIGGSQS